MQLLVAKGRPSFICLLSCKNNAYIPLSEPKTVQFFIACECFRKDTYLFHACELSAQKSYDFSTLADIFLTNCIQRGGNYFLHFFTGSLLPQSSEVAGKFIIHFTYSSSVMIFSFSSFLRSCHSSRNSFSR